MSLLEHRQRGAGRVASPVRQDREAAAAIPSSCADEQSRGLGGWDGRCGFTLIEIVIASVVIALMLVAALSTFGAVARDYDMIHEYQMGHLLAEALMAEILQQWYVDPEDAGSFGVEMGESTATRADFDDVDDYDGWSRTGPEARDGTAIAGADGWTRSASVCWVDVLDPTTAMGADTGLKKVEVAVLSPRGKTFTIQALHSSSGQLALRPPAGRTFVVGLEAQLQIGTEETVSVESVAISNHAEDQ